MNQIGVSFLLMLGMGWNPFAKAGNFDMQLKVHAVDEVGQPVSDATLLASYGKNRANSLKKGRIETLTDENGFAGTPVFNTYGRVSFGMEKEGYYSFGFADHFYQNPGENFIRPYDPFEKPIKVLMRSVLNPIPMYVKKVETKLPEPGIEYGYDLFVGDWVTPLGKGKVRDLTFKTEGYWKDYRNNDARLTLRFVNEDSGLALFLNPYDHGPKLRSENNAPKSGYESIKVWRQYRKQAEDSRKKDEVIRGYKKNGNYYFRIRVERDEEGEIINSYYGKIYGDIEFGGASEEGCYLNFTYYLNPKSNDRNVEFDPNKNLFGGSDKFAP